MACLLLHLISTLDFISNLLGASTIYFMSKLWLSINESFQIIFNNYHVENLLMHTRPHIHILFPHGHELEAMIEPRMSV